MNIKRPGRKDTAWFVIALLLPAAFAGADYLESDREMTQIAQAQARRAAVAENGRMAPAVSVASTDRQGR